VFIGATAVLAGHILVSAVLAPRPGRAAGDHVAAALVPLLLLAGAAWAFPRLPSGWRAGMSLALGVLTLAGGGVALSGAAAGASRWTGILLVPAGAVLVGLGLWSLWKARRRGGHRVLRAALIAVAVVLGAYVIVLPISMAIVATNRPPKPVPEAAAADLGRPAEAVTVETADGLTLRGWYVRSRNGAAIVTFPREWTSPQARVLVEHGYGVLLLDMRGYGDSEGDPNAYGWGSSADVGAGIDYLERQPDVEDGRIGAIGLSVGGEQVLEAAAGDPRLRAVVSEGAGERSVRESLVRGMRGWPAVPSMTVQTAAVTVFSGRTPPPSLRDLVGRIAPRPVFFVYAEHGGGGEELTPEYYAAAGQPKQQWMVPGAGHTGGLRAQPDEYERRLIQFFDEAL
jgi:fermentation-respiration switch protein FrsA (DUF1100 family)